MIRKKKRKVLEEQVDRIINPPVIMSQAEIDRLRKMTFAELTQHNYKAVRAIRRAQRKFDRIR